MVGFFRIFLHPESHKTTTTMKIKLTTEQIKDIVNDPEKAAASISVKDPWWMIALKVLKYVCELLIAAGAGYLAVSCSRAAGFY